MPNADLLTLLADLVAFDTESSKSNLNIVAYIEAYLKRFGLEPVIVPNATGEKAAIMVTIGPADRPGLVLSGHTDVVPVAGQAWTSDPFKLRVADGKAYGRGSVDMKGFDALCLAFVPEFLKADLKQPVHLMFSYDEETTCEGSLGMLERFGRDLPMPFAAIIGEPTDLEVADAHKSVVTFDTTIHGFEIHSSNPAKGANAVHAAARMIGEIERIAEDMIKVGDPTGRFDPPYTTVHVGEIHGGTARNIVPKLCSFHWEYRGVPGVDSDTLVRARLERFAQNDVLPRLSQAYPEARIETVNFVHVPGLKPEPGSRAEHLALALAGRNATIAVPYGTEAGQFQKAGIPTVVCGPGSISVGHQPDEYITLEALAEGEGFMRRLITKLS